MEEEQLLKIWTASGYLDSQLVIIYLESFGIKAITFGESVGAAYGLTTTPLGEVDIYVKEKDAERARDYMGKYK